MSTKIDINTGWQFLQEDCKREELPNKIFAPINLPHTWNNIDGVSGGNNYYRGLCWYTRTVDLDMQKVQENKRIFLDFEGVNSVCDVYVHGTHMGRHEGGYSGFRFDITHVAQPQTTIEVAVDNRHIEEVYPLFADFTFYGGIYRDVHIIYTEDICIEKMDLASPGVYISQNKVTGQKASVEVLVKARSYREENIPVICQVAWLDAAGNQVLKESQTRAIAGTQSAGGYHNFIFKQTIANPTLWQGVENPYLYTCVVTLEVDGRIIDTEKIAVGLRSYEFDEEKGFFLNGKRVKLNGVSRHQDRAGVGNALTKEHQLEDMKLIKEMGANSIRLAHYQHSQYFYDLCDQEGMIVWAEIPYISKTSDTDPTASNAISQMRELIRQSYNHASIVLWGVQNEIGIMQEKRTMEEIVRQIHDVAKEEDSTRPTTQAQVMMTPEDDPSHYVTDTVAWNKYYGWYIGQVEDFADFIESFRSKNPNKAFGISEYGAEGILKLHSDNPQVKDYSEEYHALYHEKALKIFNQYDYVWGTYVWNMFDFGSDMRDEGGVQGMNNKGLVTFDRTIKKDAYFWYQSMWSTTPMVHITSKRFVERHTDTITVKVYSNQPEVLLTHNGNSVPLTQQDGTIFYFDITLQPGDNHVQATAGNLTDETTWLQVDTPNTDYILPESEKQKGLSLDTGENITNWFDKDQIAENFSFPEGFLSIKEPIKDVLAHPEAEQVLKTYLAPLFEHPMFAMVQGMSLENIARLQADSFPLHLLVAINNELIKIKK